MADTEEGSDGEAPTVLAAHMTIDFPHVALQVEDDILESAARPEPDWEVHRMSKLLKQQLRLKRQGRVRSPSVDQGRAADSPSPRSRGSQMEHQRASADIPEKDFDDWNRRPNLRIGPDITRTSSPAFHVLPDGRLYCNLQFALLKAKDKVTYTWVDPNGCRYCRKTTTKMLGQRRTWSWNYIDLSEDRARRLPGGWQIRVAVNGHQVLQAAFNVLADWISVEKGSLPIILLCPQSGRIVPADCRQRTPDQGDDRACADTFEIARNVKSHLIYMFGVAPTVISCRLHRRWLDVNLSEPNAFTDAKMAPYYHAYYAAVLSAIQHAWKVQRRSPLIISLSAHHAFSETIYISTLNGKTVAGMRERGEGGDPRFTNEGLNARLSASRFTVVPANRHERDDPQFSAGQLVRTFGHEHEWHSDALDVICPSWMCRGYALRPLTRDLAESVGLMYQTYVHDEYVPPPSRRLCTKTAVQDGRKRTGEDEEDDSEKGQRTMSYGGVQWGGALTGN